MNPRNLSFGICMVKNLDLKKKTFLIWRRIPLQFNPQNRQFQVFLKELDKTFIFTLTKTISLQTSMQNKKLKLEIEFLFIINKSFLVSLS